MQVCRSFHATQCHAPLQQHCRTDLRPLQTARTLCKSSISESQASRRDFVVKLGTVLAAVQVAILPTAGAGLAELDTTTEKKGLGATVEGSDISNEDQQSVLAKLREKILPEAKELLRKVGKGEGSNYPSSMAKELETVDLEVNDLINQANKGGNMSNIKSAASGIEQQVNALKAIIGFD